MAKSLKFISFLFLISLVTACASAPKTLTPEGRQVRLMKSDPQASCEELEVVWGEKQTWEDDNAARNRLRNKAGQIGANYVRMEVISGTHHGGGSEYYKLSGTAYKCP